MRNRARRRAYGIIYSLVLMLGMTSPKAVADISPAYSIYLGVQGGLHLRLTDWDLNANPDATESPAMVAPWMRLSLGGQFHPMVGVELRLGTIPFTSSAGIVNVVLTYGADVIITPLQGAWTPLVLVGAGTYHNLVGDHGVDQDWEVHYGVGVRGMLTESLALRVEVQHLLSDAMDEDAPVGHNLSVMVGLDVMLFRDVDPLPPPPDRDADGVLDPDDRCPDDPGEATHGGCPDRDSDGIVDMDDRCPDVAGLDSLKGCPKKTPPKTPPPSTAAFDGVLDAVLFEVNSDKIPAKENARLRRVAETLKSMGSVRIRIDGHADDRASERHNESLALRRAEIVKAFLVAQGVPTEEILTIGYGETRPIADNSTEGGRAANRRAEIRIHAP